MHFQAGTRLRVEPGFPSPRINHHFQARGAVVKTIDEMLSLGLLSLDQHREIGTWVAAARTPEAIMQMPSALWRALELASVLMNFDADLMRPPLCEGEA